MQLVEILDNIGNSRAFLRGRSVQGEGTVCVHVTASNCWRTPIRGGKVAVNYPAVSCGVAKNPTPENLKTRPLDSWRMTASLPCLPTVHMLLCDRWHPVKDFSGIYSRLRFSWLSNFLLH